MHKVIDEIERIQRRGARFISENYRSRDATWWTWYSDTSGAKEGTATFVSIQDSRGLVPAIESPHDLTKTENVLEPP